MIEFEYLDKPYKFKIIKETREAFELEKFIDKYNNIFDIYDYILGDYSSDSLRIKGFCNVNNKCVNKYNNYENIDNYINNRCNYRSKYFVLERIR